VSLIASHIARHVSRFRNLSRRSGGCALCAAFLVFVVPISGQEIDAIVTSENRKPATIADEIRDPGERAAYIALFAAGAPEKSLLQAQDFLRRFPQSAFLAMAYEIAARASFDLGNRTTGLEYARQSLRLYPENPLLLVAVADIQAREHLNDAAIATAEEALDALERFARPIAIAESDWPGIKAGQQASAYFARGRALVQKALKLPVDSGPVASNEPTRLHLLKQATTSLVRARSLNPADTEISYLLAENYLLANDLDRASEEFAVVYRGQGEFAAKAKEQLQLIYGARANSSATRVDSSAGFEAFVESAARRRTLAAPSASSSVGAAVAPAQHREYAGSAACKDCHGGIYRQWEQTGMSHMLQPYDPQKVIGDFERNNEFYAGDDIAYRNGELQIAPGPDRALLARMVLRKGRHYFEIKQSDGLWHTYPVDYTIGSKWQQAYATILPNKQIHVFPIQYSTIQKRWINYWKVIDSPGTVRSNPYNWESFSIATNYQANCAICHTSQLRNITGGGLDADNLVFREPGIGCEECHGPSAAHIAAITSGETDGETADPLAPPVHFNRLNNRDFVSICAQCHMQSNIHAASPKGELNYSSASAFFLRNPSAPFAEFSRKGFFKDGRFSQTTFVVEAFQRSQCFRKGNASCGSCHNPHDHNGTANNTSLKFKDDPDRMCVNCHAQFADRAAAQAHTHHAVDSEASRCVSCHMPRIVDALLFRARSHQIDDIPDAEMTQRFGQADSPNACLLCHADKPAAWVKANLASWTTLRANKPSEQAIRGASSER
jgi:predicted CXXCH cytochrome family protein